VEVPDLAYLAVDATGSAREGSAFGEAIESLYSVGYTNKFMRKSGSDRLEMRMMPVEPCGRQRRVLPPKDETAWRRETSLSLWAARHEIYLGDPNRTAPGR
jgi:hypothetical protein